MAVRPTDEAVHSAVAAQQTAISDVIAFLHGHPELGHEEHACSAYLATRLQDAGLSVKPEWAGMGTALRAELTGAHRGPTVGLILVYDAVPAHASDGSIVPDHSCGHGALAAGVVGAACALAGLRDELSGRVAVLGCPADEIHAPGTAHEGGGKARAAASGACDDLDAALYAHPEFTDTVWRQSRWMRREQALVAAARSLDPRRAQATYGVLRAALDANQAQPADIIIERIESEGDVEEGCRVVTRMTFLIFADDESELERASARLHRHVSPNAAWRTIEPTYAGIRFDARVAAAVDQALRSMGRMPLGSPPPLPFATDFGNITRRVPGALIGVGRDGGWAFHTDEGARQFASEEGLEAAAAIAEVLALAAVRLT